MKKITAILSLITLASMTAFGQGQIAFANGSTSLISTNSVHNGPGTGPTALAPNSFYYALFYSTTGTTLATMTQGPSATNTAAVGRMSGGSGSANSPALPGIAAGTMVNFLLVGWSANLGTTYTQASIANTAGVTLDLGPGWYGVSSLANLYVGGGTTPIPTLMGTTALTGGQNQIPSGFTLNLLPVPEPGTLALMALGSASLLLFRRKK